jgi:hypothetical protein
MSHGYYYYICHDMYAVLVELQVGKFRDHCYKNMPNFVIILHILYNMKEIYKSTEITLERLL